MEFISSQLSTPIFMVLPMAVITASVLLYRWRSRSRSGRNPLTKALLNPPGATLRAELSDEQDNLIGFLLGSAILGAYAGGFVAGQKAGPEALRLTRLRLSHISSSDYAVEKRPSCCPTRMSASTNRKWRSK